MNHTVQPPATSRGWGRRPLSGGYLIGVPESLALLVLAILSLAVILHWFQLGDLNAYRNSLLIPVEFFALLGALLMMPALLIRAIYLLCCRQFRQAAVNILLIVTAIAVVVWATWFDAPTLIYMT